jgi:hypothetical protein
MDFGNKLPGYLDPLTSAGGALDKYFANALAIPFVGQQLDKVAEDTGLQNDLDQIALAIKNIQDSGNIVSDVQNALYSLLGPNSTLNFLAVQNASAFSSSPPSPGPQDISVTPLDSGSGVSVQMLLRKQFDVSAQMSNFDLGLGTFLTVKSTNGLHVTLDVDYLFRATYRADGTLTLADSNGNTAQLSALDASRPATPLAFVLHVGSADPQNPFQIGATLNGLLYATATDNGDSTFDGSLGVGLTTSGGISDITFQGTGAKIDLSLALQFSPTSGSDFNPKLSTQLTGDWTFDSPTSLTSALGSFGSLGDISFSNVSIDVGSLVPGFLSGMISNIKTFTKPLALVADLLTTPVPGLSDIGINLDIAKLVGGDDLENTLQTIKDLNSLPDTFTDTGSINLGSFKVSDVRQTASPQVDQNALSPSTDLASQIQGISNDNFFSQLPGLSTSPSGSATAADPSGFDFPLLTDPVDTAFQLLIGNDQVKLFSLKLGIPHQEFGLSTSIPVAAIASIDLSFGIGFDASLDVGYDAAGLKLAATDRNPGNIGNDLLHGFYINTAGTGLTLEGHIGLGASIVVFQAEGDLVAALTLGIDPSLDDPGTSKARLDTLKNAFAHDADCIFALSGEIYVTLSASFGLDVPGLGFQTLYTFELGRLDLLTFDSACPTNPSTANSIDNVLRLNVHSGDKLHVHSYALDYFPDGANPYTNHGIEVDNANGSKTFYPVYQVQHVQDFHGNFLYDLTYSLRGTDNQLHPYTTVFASTKDLDSATIIVDDLSDGNDGTQANAILLGGAGNDHFEYHGKGKSLLVGGGGNDVLIGGQYEFADGMPDFYTGQIPIGGTMQSFHDFYLNQFLPWTPPDIESNYLIGYAISPTDNLGSSSDVAYLQGAAADDDILMGGKGTTYFNAVPGFQDNYIGGSGTNIFQFVTNSHSASYVYGGSGTNTVEVRSADTYDLYHDPQPPDTLSVNVSDTGNFRDSNNAAILEDSGNLLLVYDVAKLDLYVNGTITIGDLGGTDVSTIYTDAANSQEALTLSLPYFAANTVTESGASLSDGRSGVHIHNDFQYPNGPTGAFDLDVTGLNSQATIEIDGGGKDDTYNVQVDNSFDFTTHLKEDGTPGNHSLILDGTALFSLEGVKVGDTAASFAGIFGTATVDYTGTFNNLIVDAPSAVSSGLFPIVDPIDLDLPTRTANTAISLGDRGDTLTVDHAAGDLSVTGSANGASTIIVKNVAGTLTYYGNGAVDTINLGGGNTAGITGTVNLYANLTDVGFAPAQVNVIVDDSQDPNTTEHSITVSPTELYDLVPGTVHQGGLVTLDSVAISGNPATNFSVGDTPAGITTTISCLGPRMQVYVTTGSLVVNVLRNGGGVLLGSGDVSRLKGEVTINGAGANVTVDDAGSNRTYTANIDMDAEVDGYYVLTGMGGSAIRLPATLQQFTIEGNGRNAASTFEFDATPLTTWTSELDWTGGQVLMYGTSAPLKIVGASSINVGEGNVQNIQGEVTIDGTGASVTVDDSTSNQTYTADMDTDAEVDGYDVLTGIGGYAIRLPATMQQFQIKGNGQHPESTFTFDATPSTVLTSELDWARGQVLMYATSAGMKIVGASIVNVGEGSVQNIAQLEIDQPFFPQLFTAVVVDASRDPGPVNARLEADGLSIDGSNGFPLPGILLEDFLPNGSINIDANASLTIDAPAQAANQFTVDATPGYTSLNAGSGTVTVNGTGGELYIAGALHVTVGNGVLTGIHNIVYINEPGLPGWPRATDITVNDKGDQTGRAYSVFATSFITSTFAGPGLPTIDYEPLTITSLVLQGGTGSNTWSLSSPYPTDYSTEVDSGAADTVTVSGLSGQLKVQGGTVSLGGTLGLSNDLQALVNNTIPVDGTFPLVRDLTGNALQGTFDSLPEGSILTLNGARYVLSYQGDASGQDVVLTHQETPPTMSGLSIAAATEGEPASLTGTLTEPDLLDTLTLMVSWGDGSTRSYNYSPGSGTVSFNVSHVYSEESPTPLPVSVTVSDGYPNGTAAASLQVSVNDAPLSLQNLGSPFLEGRPQLGPLAILTDPGNDGMTADYSATIDWGDNTTSPAVVQMLGDGTLEVFTTGSHVYAGDEGAAYLAQLSVTDVGGASTSLSIPVSIVDSLLTQPLNLQLGDPVGSVSNTITIQAYRGAADEPAPDDIRVIENGVVLYQGGSENLTSISFYGAGASDLITITGDYAAVPIFISLAGGNSAIDVQPDAALLGTGQADVFIQGGGLGTTTLTVDDRGDPSGTAWLLGGNAIQSSGVSIGFDQVASLDLLTDHPGNTFNVYDTAGVGAEFINAIGGNDTFNVSGSANTLDPIQAPLDLNGQANSDTYYFNDAGTGIAQAYVLSATTLSRSGAATIAFTPNPLDQIYLYTGSATNFINVVSTALGGTYNVAANGLVTISSTSNTLDPIQGAVTVIGQGGNTVLDFNDLNGTPGAAPNQAYNYSLAGSSFTRTGMGTVTFSGIQSVNLYAANAGGNGFNVLGVSSTAPGTSYSVYAGTGLNEFLVFDLSYTLNGIQGPLFLHGSSGTLPNNNAVFLDDVDKTTRHTFFVNAGATSQSGFVQRTNTASGLPDMAPISYDGLNAYSVLYTAGSAGATINVQSQAADLFSVFGVGTGDTVNISSPNHTMAGILGDLRVQAAVGQMPTVNLDDSGDSAAHAITVSPDSANGYLVSGLLPPSSVGRGRVWLLAPTANVSLSGGSGGNTFNIQATGGGVTTINTGASGDTVNVGSVFNTLDPIQGAVTVIGQGGNATLNFNDQGGTPGTAPNQAYNYSLAGSSFTRTGTATVTFSGMVAVNLYAANAAGSGGFNDLGVASTAPGTSYSVYAGTGLNEFIVFELGYTLNGIQGPLFLHGAGGSLPNDDLVALYDVDKTTRHTLSVNAGATPQSGVVQRFNTASGLPDMAPISYDGLNAYSVMQTAGSAGATINIQSQAAALYSDFYVGASDTVNIGSPGHTMAGILGDLGVVADVGATPTVNLDDSGDSGRSITVAPDLSAPTTTYQVSGLLPPSSLGYGLLWLGAPEAKISLLGGIGTNTLSFTSPGDFTPSWTISAFTSSSFTVPGNFTGQLLAPTLGTASAPVQQIQVGGAMAAGAKIKVDYLNSLSVGGDLAGTVKGFGNSGSQSQPTIGTITVGGNLASTGSITAPILGTVAITGNDAGTISESNPTQDMKQLTIGGALTSTGVVSAASIGSMSVGQGLAGQVTVSGPLNTLTVTGNLSGNVSATTIGIVTVSQNLTGQVTATQSLGSVTAGNKPVAPSYFLLDLSIAGAVNASGNASIHLPGGLFVDSNSAKAVLLSGNAKVAATSIQVVGGVQRSGNATISPSPTTGSKPFADPLAFLSGPSANGLTNYGSVSYRSGKHTLHPGIYSQIKASGNASLTLNPGLYIIEGGGIAVGDNASVTGAGVMIYNTGSNYPNAGGCFGGITLSGNGSFTLTPAATAGGGAFPGIVIYQSRSNTRALLFGGNAAAGLTGMVYAPSAPVVISGNATLNAALVADRLQFSGNGSSTQVAAGSTGDDSSSPDTLLAGDLEVYVKNGNGSFTHAELARIQDAIRAWDRVLAPYHVQISEVNNPALANLILDMSSTSPAGTAADGVLGCYDGATNEITLLQGWNWYDGAKPGRIGPSQYDFQTVVTHELGHALGLGGSADPTSPMLESLAAGVVRRIPHVADLNIPEAPDGADPERAAFPSVGEGFSATITGPATNPSSHAVSGASFFLTLANAPVGQASGDAVDSLAITRSASESLGLMSPLKGTTPFSGGQSQVERPKGAQVAPAIAVAVSVHDQLFASFGLSQRGDDWAPTGTHERGVSPDGTDSPTRALSQSARDRILADSASVRGIALPARLAAERDSDGGLTSCLALAKAPASDLAAVWILVGLLTSKQESIPEARPRRFFSLAH